MPPSERINDHFGTYPHHLRTYPDHLRTYYTTFRSPHRYVRNVVSIGSGRITDRLYSSPPFVNLHSLTTPEVWSKADDTLVLKIVWDILPPHLYISSESGQFVVGAVEVVGALRSGTAV